MKTPKEKAEELVLKYLRLQEEGSSNWFHKILAIKCSLMAVDEILWEIIKYADNSKEYVVENTDYWEEVKEEVINYKK